MQEQTILGVDVGASGIKGAVIDVHTGTLRSERLRFPTPDPSLPAAVAATFAALVTQINWEGPIGCGFPSIIRQGVAYTASNIDKSWIGANVATLFQQQTGREVYVLNDADAAGMAEMRFGKGKGQMGTIILVTIGSGLGTAVFVNGSMIPNTELGHLYLPGHKRVAEFYASNNAKKRDNLSWMEWAKRFDEYLVHLEVLFSPDLFILGGGTSKYFDLYKECFTVVTPITPAELLNSAGMVGAAAYAKEQHECKKVH
ncbi:MAG TPA: ROK family protein [Saprospiraceae bacterium]|nr:ROK family protein [Saprospiraceae bacterium]HMP24579.1 ROK family protein [Saprospiraceae bacterium]